MVSVEKELTKAYMSRVIEQMTEEDMERLVKTYLPRENRVLTIKEFLKAFGKKRLRTFESYQKKYDIKLDDVVTCLYSISSSTFPAPKDIKALTKSEGASITFILSIFLTEDYKLLLLKGHMYEDEIVYFISEIAIHLKKSLTEEIFFIEYLPEFLQFSQPDERLELYSIKKDVYQQTMKYITQYSTVNDLLLIKQGLLSRNSRFEDLDVELVNKKTMKIKYGNEEKIVQFADCKLTPINSQKGSYRTKTEIQFKDDMDAIVIKAREPGTNKSHFVYVTNVDFEIEKREEDNRSLLNVSALFRKTEEGLKLETELGRDSALKYKYIYDVELS